ncbi:hypothetical protein B0T25DRAFT_495912 [Lasiosphaeria hispida]|uniref:Protein farnesyltransferase/geranylgeranyltransferase type-1 subunit alpha n=1 Tax=Lasiosphaeria hispida TaxID=260671 RepID=A0AAJ0HRI9_9PEZI|nr:hypothetical protein B0T25DRAFT_495912 [Lasiosphaeria hispida]
MPPKSKAAPKPKGADSSKQPTLTPSTSNTTPAVPATVAARSQLRYDDSRPHDAARLKAGLTGLPRDEQAAWISARFARTPAARTRLPPKAQRELWRQVNEASLPVRALRGGTKGSSWGRDRNGLDVGGYSVERFDEREARRARLTCLEVASRGFRERRERERKGLRDPATGEAVFVSEGEVDAERVRRGEMADLRRELYGTVQGSFALDPEWDDVIPIPQDEPEAALAAIAYPADYDEAISYLRAVMLKKEYSQRCLRLTETIIEMNPAHYTVWLYRASNVFALKLPIADELEWLNQVAFANLKNYQIWHHRHLLVDNLYPALAEKPDELARFAAAERDFLTQILVQDTKNYHVWSYRSYLVGKLGVWGSPEELKSIEGLIDDDVRNNSAWSHRFFLVFSDPAHTTPGLVATEPDPAVPQDITSREVEYAKEKISLAPQNQSPWNYLKGVLVKGRQKLSSVEEFTGGFVKGLGNKDGSEDVQSTHALDLLAEIYAEKGDKEKADLCLRRLGEKWDRIRVGYWEWRRKCLEEA